MLINSSLLMQPISGRSQFLCLHGQDTESTFLSTTLLPSRLVTQKFQVYMGYEQGVCMSIWSVYLRHQSHWFLLVSFCVL